MTPPHPIRILELRSVRGTGGGPEKTILLGAARSDPERFAVTICYLRDARDAAFHIDRRASSLSVEYVEFVERHSLDPRVWPRLRAFVRQRRFDIVHAHDYKTDLLAWCLARAEPIIPMSTAHGWSGHGWKERLVYYPADRQILARFPLALTVSSDVRDAILAVGGHASRIIVVPNGIDDQVFRRDPLQGRGARERFVLPPEAVAIGAVGRLEAEKNYPLLVRAFADVCADHPTAHLLIAGDGSRRGEIESLSLGLGIGDRVRLVGHLAEVITFHEALDLFVMCSDNEGSPNAVLEAMALETPVVCTDVGGVSDLVTDGREALLVPPRDQRALARAMRESISAPAAARERARAARHRVEQTLSFERRMARVEALYVDLLATYPRIRQGRRWWEAERA